jgi:hypothetical protein
VTALVDRFGRRLRRRRRSYPREIRFATIAYGGTALLSWNAASAGKGYGRPVDVQKSRRSGNPLCLDSVNVASIAPPLRPRKI